MNLPGNITGVGSYAPDLSVTNTYLAEKSPGVNPAWVEQVLGIKERHIATNDDSLGYMAARAGRRALYNAGLHSVDLIIVASSSSIIPPLASHVQRRLEITCPAFDLNAICTGFLTALITAYQLLPHYENILVVGVDAFSRFTDWTNRNCVFFGDGAGAVVVSRSTGAGILGYSLGGRADDNGSFRLSDNGLWQMDSRAVFEAATATLPGVINEVLKNAGVTALDLSHIIPHQASLNLLRHIAQLSGLPFDKFRLTLEDHGNTAAASIPLTLDKHKAAIEPGDKVLLFGIGAGWSWGAAVIEWA